MTLTWLGASSVLVIIAIAFLIAMPSYFARSRTSDIHAERNADDIIADDAELTDPAYDTVTPSRPDTGYAATFTGREAGTPLAPGRIMLVAFVVLGLAMVLVGAPIAVMTALSWWVPGAGLLLAGGSLAALRALALADARRRGRRYRDEYAAEASQIVLTKPAPEQQAEEPEALRAASTVVVDDEPAEPQRPVKQAVKSLKNARATREPSYRDLLGTAGVQELGLKHELHPAFEPATSSWEPREVPIPTYLEVAPSYAHLPQPADFASYEQAKREEEAAEKTELSQRNAATETHESTQSATGAIALDEILRRRRA
ncbi:hypothetical protein VVR12_00160 [Rothia sp. LK2588]|uniref:hypothetical protein n=1 Tax=Rothia sp. LK2588 TaxID=3114369 RepID=UPI0034CD671F